SSALIDGVEFVFEDASGDVRVFDREQASEAAARFRTREVYDLDALHSLKEPARLGSKVQLSKQVTRLVQRDSSVEASPHINDSEDVGDEVGELVCSSRECPVSLERLLIVFEQISVEHLHHADARSRRAHYDLAVFEHR